MAVLKYKDSNGQWQTLPNVMVNQINVVQTTGTSTGDVMSQSAVTENLHSHTNKTYLDGISGNVGTVAYENTSSYSSATEVETELGGKSDTATTYTKTEVDARVLWVSGTGENAIVQKGGNNTASGNYSRSEGSFTMAGGDYSHAEGYYTSATSYVSHAEGYYTITLNEYEHASGQYNVSSSSSSTFGDSGNTLFSVGNGTYNARHNAFEIKQNGDIYITTGGTKTSPSIKLQDYIGIVSAVTVNSDLSNVTCPDSITGPSNTGAQAMVIYENGGTTTDYTITVSTSYKSPDGSQISITCPKNGYCEVNYVNINGTIYARGA